MKKEKQTKKSFIVMKCSKILLFYLVLIIIFINGSIKLHATSKTQGDALQWVKSQVGKAIDYDGAYGAQCVDLIKAYYNYLGVSPVTGNGKDYATNTLPSGWSRIAGASPQPGDILVYSASTSNPYGHVAIYESNNSTYHQNFNYHSYVERVTIAYTSMSNPYWGVVRPNFTNTFFDFWTDLIINNKLNGKARIWFKQTGYGVNKECDVNLDINGKALGTIYQDSSGYFSYELDTTKYNNGTYKLGAIIRGGGKEKKVTRDIVINNPLSFDFYNFNNNQLSGKVKIQFKQVAYGLNKECDVNLDIDGKALGTLHQDGNGLFSYDFDTTKYNNGTYKFGAIIRSVWGHEKKVSKDIVINNIALSTPTPIPTIPKPTSTPVSTNKPIVNPISTTKPTPTGKSIPTSNSNKENENKEKSAPKKVKSIKIKKRTKKTLILTWNKIDSAKGYQVLYSKNNHFKKGTKHKLLTTNKFKIGNPKKKKIYYVRVRTFSINNGKKIYGKYSKSIKIK